MFRHCVLSSKHDYSLFAYVVSAKGCVELRLISHLITVKVITRDNHVSSENEIGSLSDLRYSSW